MKTIKRYQNRKLYNTDDSVYVTLDDVAEMIRAGDELRVIDNNTKNDITVTTLTQLLHERERKSSVQPSIGLLKAIIQHGDGSFTGYIQAKVATEPSRIDRNEPSQPTLNQ